MKSIDSFDQYLKQYQDSVKNPESFWSDIAGNLTWRKKWTKTLEWDFKKPEVKWFIGGKMNITENCIDRHLAERADQAAIIWEPNDPNDTSKKITYKELHREVSRVANMMKTLGVKKRG